MHSGTSAEPHGGLLTLVSQKLCAAEHLSFSTLQEGRLQHVRVKLPTQSLDILNAYQAPWRPSQSTETNLKNRKVMWDLLHTTLGRLPFRNVLALCGDFNASLLNNAHPDNSELQQLRKHHFLGTLHQSRSTEPTYYSAQGNSQIDYVMSRQCQLDSTAKDGHLLHDFHLGSWRSSLDHRPLVGTLPKQWMPWRRKPRPIVSALKIREQYMQLKRHQPEIWQQQCDMLGQKIHELPVTPTSLDPMQHLLTSHAASVNLPLSLGYPALSNFSKNLGPQSRIFPKIWDNTGKSPSAPVSHMPSSTRPPLQGGLVRQLWDTHRRYCRPGLAALPCILQKWQLWTRVHVLRKHIRQAIKKDKLQHMHNQIEDAIRAFRQHDPYRMYKVVRHLAPKAPYQTVHLRNSYGLAQDPSQELEAIVHFLHTLCDGPLWSPVTTEALTCMPFTVRELESSLAMTPGNKSVAPGTCPGILVKSLATYIAPWLFSLLTQLWLGSQTPSVPLQWKAAWITCVPKRCIRSPKDIRPIALQCAIGKAVLRILVRLAVDEVRSQLVPYPLYAYLKGRSTEQALMWIHAHLRQVREQCLAVADTAWTRHARASKPRCLGGITISLDLSNAFDTVQRAHIAAGMTTCALSASLQTLLLSWLTEVQYFVSHKGHTACIDVNKGIRQGCVASPFFWLMWSRWFLRRIEEQYGLQWIQQHLALYADDIIGLWNFHTYEELLAALHAIGFLLDLLQEMELSVSLNKSKILWRITGTSRKSVLKKHCQRIGAETCLMIPRANGDLTPLPITRHHKYLGTIISYFNPEERTLAYRLQSGRQSYFRLHKFFSSRTKLPWPMKLRLWRQCIECSYLYGLFAVGLTKNGCLRLAQAIHVDFRRLSGQWAHITHVNNSELCQKLGIVPPLEALQDRWHNHATAWHEHCQSLATNDLVRQLDYMNHWEPLMLKLAECIHEDIAPTHVPAPTVQSWPCPHCPTAFASHTLVRRHSPLPPGSQTCLLTTT